MRITLERFADVPNMGTLSTVYIDGNAFCYAIEQNWKNNQPFITCVPDGEYLLNMFESKKYGSTFAVVNRELNVFENATDRDAPNDRYACLLHKANWSHELQGCIAFGQDIRCGKKSDKFSNQLMVTSSKKTTNTVLDILKSSENNTLEIYRKQY